MAKPPIIISNGGIASELTKGLVAEDGEKRPVVQIIMDNVRDLNSRVTGANPKNEPLPVAMSLADHSGPARIYWRLSNEGEHDSKSETGAGAR